MAEKKTGRKLVPARNKKKKWSKEDEEYLCDNWGIKSLKTICKTLGRSENAVIVRARRLGCGAFLDAGLYITYNQLMICRNSRCKSRTNKKRHGDQKEQLLHRSGRAAKRGDDDMTSQRINKGFGLLFEMGCG